MEKTIVDVYEHNPLTAKILLSYASQMTDNIRHVYSTASNEDHANGLSWYQDCRDYASRLAHDHDLEIGAVVGIIAALSPMTAWPINKKRTSALVNGDSIGGLTNSKEKARSILFGNVDPVDVLGPKTRSFWDNIMFPGRADRVTIDVWSLRVALYNPAHKLDWQKKVIGSVPKYRIVSDCYRTVANENNLLPHEIQAITWATYRRAHGKKQHNQGCIDF